MIAYLSHDEVNSALARRIARRLGFKLKPLSHKDAKLVSAANGLVLDLDNLPSEYKSKLFLQIDAGVLRPGLAVHSYHLSHVEARTLRAAGVRVTRRLTSGLFGAAVSRNG
jgi:hypothetical protein